MAIRGFFVRSTTNTNIFYLVRNNISNILLCYFFFFCVKFNIFVNASDSFASRLSEFDAPRITQHFGIHVHLCRYLNPEPNCVGKHGHCSRRKPEARLRHAAYSEK